MKIEKLGEDLYKVKLPLWSFHIRKDLANAILEIQSKGKIVTMVHGFTTLTSGPAFLVCTMNK